MKLVMMKGSFFLLLFVLPFVRNSSIDYNYRLPRDIIPDNYNLTISLDYGNEGLDESMQHGFVDITANVHSPTNIITLQSYAKNNIIDVAVTSNGSVWEVTDTEFHSKTETLRIHLAENLELGALRITITYRWFLQTATSSETPRGAYITDGYDLLTQFQPAGARRVFPCFDEPNFKATFDITVQLNGFPDIRTVLSNMPLKENYVDDSLTTQTYKFKRTPIMSSYLVAIAVPLNDYDPVTFTNDGYGTVTMHNVPRQKAKIYGKLVTKSLKAMAKRTGIDYNVEKVDYAGRHASNYAMENWGLVIGSYAPTFFPIHETVHGWFGNMVTCAWWDDIWLNEGFTSYYEVLIAYQIGAYTLSKKLSEFSRLRKSALQKYGNRALHDKFYDAQYLNAPWSAVYLKGPIIIRMFHKALGNRFEPRLFSFLKQNLYKNVNSSLLISSLTKDTEMDERAMLKSFIFNIDAPLIEISYNSESRRFEIGQSPYEFPDDDTKWTVPIWFRRRQGAEEELVWAKAREEASPIQLDDDDYPEDFIFDEQCEAFAVYNIEVNGRSRHLCKPQGSAKRDHLQEHGEYLTESNEASSNFDDNEI